MKTPISRLKDLTSPPLDESPLDPLDEAAAHEQFVMLFSRERRRIYALTYSLVPNATDAEDLFQQVSLLLWRKFREYDHDRDFYRWAAGMVYYTVKNYRRTAVKRRMLFSDELVKTLVDERVNWSSSESERNEALTECLGRLRKGDTKLLADIYGSNVSAGEAAERLGKSVGTVYNRLSLLRKRLLECINNKLATRHGRGGEA